ncbi:activating signal cointegrator 1 complex subunit 3-like [Watersipora subatra]|uniref:activating signal cointegrator 1 complex subunit 3-like n=1 Tax=Watersipora subatra TaxID=2589382 RepID=UPI00355C650D
MSRPILSAQRTRAEHTVVYPNVYDSMAQAKQSSAFIGGSKLGLPEGFTKTGNKMMEEVTIPPSKGAPPDVGKDRVMISSMDQVAQMAFQNTKSLNRIQSVVYETAYHTNENLLICAPTGAGKTNIAMLTILHTIQQHIEKGVVQKDKFKIVYVAPMKALAAEMVRNFGGRLQALGVTVKELTGDMSLTKQEILKTQMLVTTPEKWDVVTRKSSGDIALVQLVKLLIIDEVHLLHEERGSVIESLVARTLRQVESSQSMIRIVGLSATLPNYVDVAHFLRVSPYVGLFFFDGRFRPVPLGMTFIGVKALNRIQRLADMNEICYDKVKQQVRSGEQVMVFVHARNETHRTAMAMRECAKQHGDTVHFSPENLPDFAAAMKVMDKSKNKQLKELFADGFAIHHAGMLRHDRNLVEKYFSDGFIKCLVCTATLAWGVNLPAHAVIIKGTDIYDSKKGAFVDLGILDVQQIFGRAGRPQFDEYGHGTIITTHDKLSHYLSLLTRQNPIESQFQAGLIDNLNAEICLGTISNLEEAVTWLSYTYMFVRMRYNPLVYGITYKLLGEDPLLENHREKICYLAAKALDKAQMIRFDEGQGYMFPTDLGRTASHYYIKYDTVQVINEKLMNSMNEGAVLEMMSHAQEFQQLKVRDDEMEELDKHLQDTCFLPVSGGSESTEGKVNILLQAFISKRLIDNFSLVSDMSYVAQNAGRIIRALFDIVIRKGWSLMTSRLLTLCKVIEQQLWEFEHPLRQFSTLRPDVLNKLEQFDLSLERMREMDGKEIGHMIRHVNMGSVIKKMAHTIPMLQLEPSVQPITRTVLRMKLGIAADFEWADRHHGNVAESFWIWVEDPDTFMIYHHEYFTIQKKQVVRKEPLSLIFTIPIKEPLPSQYIVHCSSDRWLGSDSSVPVSFKHLILPERHPPHTNLLDLQPLPVAALGEAKLADLYKFSHFNPVQTQIFHTLYHTDTNVLLGAPTGSGKTVAAELAIFRLFMKYPGQKAVYIAPLKALVRERIDDWKARIERKLGKKVVEMTGDIAPDMRAIAAADLIVTTPEKWDGVSRSWQNRNYVQKVTLVIIDEIHLLGADRGPVLEVVVSRTNFISATTGHKVRVVGLSTALANARDLADWLCITESGLFNFRPSVRPVPLEVHISGFPGKHYCPRMATMNRPCFKAIKQHSPEKPVLIFVSSRRQTRLTALELISLLATDDRPKQWLHTPEEEIMNIISGMKDTNLKLTLAFGIGIHHAGLHERDRKTVEELFVNQKIQILVATSTLAWGVNFPAHLVIVKGTEYFDGKVKRYVDFPITDVLQMMGRAGRPQFDDHGVAVIFVHDVKKHFYKKFLYEPFPVESSLLGVLADHMNAEIVAGTVTNKQAAMDYVTWTYFFRRLVQNPTYYELDDTDPEHLNKYLSALVERTLRELQDSGCISIEEDNYNLHPETLGRISSYYYLSHVSVRMFSEKLEKQTSIEQVLQVLSDAEEYAELPVRHNEDHLNADLAQKLPQEVDKYKMDDSHTKAYILLQAHLSRCPLPSTDYLTDTKSVMDQAIRILQGMLDMVADAGWLNSSLQVIIVLQMLIQGRWLSDSSFLTLPYIEEGDLPLFRELKCLPALMYKTDVKPDFLPALLKKTDLSNDCIEQVVEHVRLMPRIAVSVSLRGVGEVAGDADVEHAVKIDAKVRSEEKWLQVSKDQEYTVVVNLRRTNKFKRSPSETKALSRAWPKPKDEGWVIVIGHVESGELWALKRVGFVRGQTSVSLSIVTPYMAGRHIFTLYVLSDSYLGLDQQFDLHLEVTDD